MSRRSAGVAFCALAAFLLAVRASLLGAAYVGTPAKPDSPLGVIAAQWTEMALPAGWIAAAGLIGVGYLVAAELEGRRKRSSGADGQTPDTD